MIELDFCCKSSEKSRNRCITARKSCIKSGKMRQEHVPWQIIPVGTCIIVKITLSNKKKQKKITLFQCIFGLKLTLFQWIPD